MEKGLEVKHNFFTYTLVETLDKTLPIEKHFLIEALLIFRDCCKTKLWTMIGPLYPSRSHTVHQKVIYLRNKDCTNHLSPRLVDSVSV